jgi:endoglucanase
VSGTNYQFVGPQDFAYIKSVGSNFVRLIFGWECLQPTLNGPFNATYLANMTASVEACTSLDGYCMIEPHPEDSNGVYAGWMGNVVGSAGCPNTAFANLWSQLATQWMNNPYVVFGLCNEPNSMSTMQWYQAAQAAITAIRATGATNLIMVGGTNWQDATSWTETYYDTASPQVSNATGWLTLNDPLKNTVCSVHTYPSPTGDASNAITNVNIFVTNLTPMVAWARTNGIMVHVSEFGASSTNSIAMQTCANMNTFMNANSDVFLGCSWWTDGLPSWYGSYIYNMCPTNNYTGAPANLPLLQQFFTTK